MRYLLVLLIGVILGGALTFYFLVGAPRVKPIPGTAVQAPEASGDAPGTALLILDEKFFEALLGTVFRDLSAPTFQLAANGRAADSAIGGRFIKVQTGCPNQVVVAPEGSGVRTGVRLAEGKILAPLAFSGSYNLLGNCINFRGAAQANVQLYFKPEEQTLYGQINVEGVNLEGVSPIFSGPITLFVQNAINQRVNPLVIMRGSQLSLNVPVQASNGMLKAQAKDVRSEVKDNALRLHITYDFSGARGLQPSPPQG